MKRAKHLLLWATKNMAKCVCVCVFSSFFLFPFCFCSYFQIRGPATNVEMKNRGQEIELFLCSYLKNKNSVVIPAKIKLNDSQKSAPMWSHLKQ